MIAEMVRRYSVLGLDCTNLELQKLGWFLHRAIQKHGLDDPLKLTYSANKFGPYSDNLRHLLNALDGSYLHCEKRLSDAGPLDLIWFESSKKSVVTQFLESEECKPYQRILDDASQVIDGFESPLGMELLATVDWLIASGTSQRNTTSVRQGLQKWPGGPSSAKRKCRLFDDRLIQIAINRLESSGLPPNP